jgi:hypothetical protein
MAFLDPGRVITIGESATPIIEGEPFSHPGFSEVVALVRRVFPDTPMEITTNGRMLTGEIIALLEELGGIVVHVSLNSASERGRGLLMQETQEESRRTIAGVGLLAASQVRFSGSLVAMPNLVGWDDIRETIVFLAEKGATAVGVVVPAFSSRADPAAFPDSERIYAEVREFVGGLPPDTPCPVLVEPSYVSDLVPAVSGVVKGSSAWMAGIRRDDIFETINGRRPRSRVEAWNMLLPAGEVVAGIRRDGGVLSVSWTNRREGDAGVTMEYDFDPYRAEMVRDTVLGHQGYSVLLASELGHAVLRRALQIMDVAEPQAEVVMVKNRTFGGSIKAAGLLTVDDYLESYNAWREERCTPSRNGAAPALLIVPTESFDSRGFDLRRVHVSELEKATGVPVLVR